MKKILVPLIAGTLIGCVVGVALIWSEFGGLSEVFINYKP